MLHTVILFMRNYGYLSSPISLFLRVWVTFFQMVCTYSSIHHLTSDDAGVECCSSSSHQYIYDFVDRKWHLLVATISRINGLHLTYGLLVILVHGKQSGTFDWYIYVTFILCCAYSHFGILPLAVLTGPFRSRRWALKEGHWKKALVKYFRCPKANWKAIVNGGMIWTNDPMINPNSECWAVSYLLELSTSNNPLPGLFLVFHSYLWLLLPCDAISPKNMTNH